MLNLILFPFHGRSRYGVLMLTVPKRVVTMKLYRQNKMYKDCIEWVWAVYYKYESHYGFEGYYNQEDMFEKFEKDNILLEDVYELDP